MSSPGLAADLGYSHASANPVHRLVRSGAGTRIGGWIFSRSLRHLDVTTTGRKSGQRRTSHLIATPYDGTLALLGTNFGQPSTPAWVLNLEADPQATITYRNVSREVTARPATPAEADEIFALAGRFYPGYLSYRQRIGENRRVRAFVLEPL